MKEVASLRYGVIFKKAFSRPNIFKAFVKDFLNIDLEIDVVETEKSFSPNIGSVDSRFDLFAEDKKQRTIVDIQHVRTPDHYNRFLHYHCAALLEQVVHSRDYRPDLKVFTIVVLTSGDRHAVDMATVDFDPKSRKGRFLGEIPHKILYLCPKYVEDNTPEPYREWLRAINDSLDGKVEETEYHLPAIHEIFDLIQKDMTTPQEYAKMKDEYSAGLVRDELEKKGERKGEKKGILTVAKKMKQKSMEAKIIMEITGLSIAELDKLK